MGSLPGSEEGGREGTEGQLVHLGSHPRGLQGRQQLRYRREVGPQVRLLRRDHQGPVNKQAGHARCRQVSCVERCIDGALRWPGRQGSCEAMHGA
jgi:hypothetical protein